LSAATQVAHFGSERDLVCLTVDLTPLGETVSWEPSRRGELFPHLYAPLPVSAVQTVRPIPDALDARGAFAAGLAR
jgi:uncharacterized protein (DUF952 family)